MTKKSQNTPNSPNTPNKDEISSWFKSLQTQICDEFESIETALAPESQFGKEQAGKFEIKDWKRADLPADNNTDRHLDGGGTMAIMHGRVFEKVGVNISLVHGHFSPEFRKQIPGAQDNDGAFWASGISLVAHMQSPYVPAVHMNTRHIVTSKGWFGGGADLTPMFIPGNTPQDEADKAFFHNEFQKTCDKYDPDYYPKFKKWCDDYFYLPHRREHRGIGGIFYDYLDSGDTNQDFNFTKDVGTCFLNTYSQIVRKYMNLPWSEKEREHQLIRRGRYVEFNLLYDRGTKFGLETGGNTEAILMSMPPEVKWP